MEITHELVSPAKATKWLNANVCNRNLREGIAEKYAEDMRSGQWTVCTAPIAFYEDGELADGQHRLFAIVESEQTQRFVILRGLPRDAGLNIDTGATRSLIDNARISGTDTDLSHSLISAARAIHDGARAAGGTRSNAQKLALVARYREPAAFAAAHCPRKKFVGNGPMLGAIGRAYMHEVDNDRLQHFCDVLRTGFMDNEGDSAAVAIRNYLMTRGTNATTSSAWIDTFWKCQNALYAFMRRRSLTWIKGVRTEAYPLVEPNARPTKGHKGRVKREAA